MFGRNTPTVDLSQSENVSKRDLEIGTAQIGTGGHKNWNDRYLSTYSKYTEPGQLDRLVAAPANAHSGSLQIIIFEDEDQAYWHLVNPVQGPIWWDADLIEAETHKASLRDHTFSVTFIYPQTSQGVPPNIDKIVPQGKSLPDWIHFVEPLWRDDGLGYLDDSIFQNQSLMKEYFAKELERAVNQDTGIYPSRKIFLIDNNAAPTFLVTGKVWAYENWVGCEHHSGWLYQNTSNNIRWLRCIGAIFELESHIRNNTDYRKWNEF